MRIGLSKKLFEFRKEKQTIYSINEVVRIAQEVAACSHKHRRLCGMITLLDVRNAFNRAPRQQILEELRKR